MRILFSVPLYKPAYRFGGPIASVAALAENLVKRGHQVVVFTSNSNLDEDLDVPVNQPIMVNGVEIWYFEHKEFFKEYLQLVPYLSQSVGYLYLPALRKILNQRIREFDLVHTHMPFVYSTYAVAKAAIKHNIPIFYHQRGAFAPAYLRYHGLKKYIYISLFEKKIMEKAAILIALTDAEVASYRGLGVKTPCRIIPNGIDTQYYAQKKDGEMKLSDQFIIKAENIVILFLARLHIIKGADFLLDVFLEIINKYPKAQLVLAGPDQHNFKEKLLAKVVAEGASGRVFLPGMVTGDLKHALLARADLFCQPSMGEGFSVSILEAMASTTPILATPECNFPTLEKEAAGYIVEKNLEKWIEKISYLMDNPSKMCLMGRNAFSIVKHQYTWDKIVNRLEEVYIEGLQGTDRKF